MRPALDHARDHARLLQHLQVLGDRGLGHPEAAGGVAHRRRAGGEALDDAAADRVREGPERIVNHKVNGSIHGMHAQVGDLAPTTRSTARARPLVLLHGAYMTIEHDGAAAAGAGRDAAGDRRRAAGARPHRRHRPPDHLRADGRRHRGPAASTSEIEQADVVGYSMGGGVALQLAIRHPAARAQAGASPRPATGTTAMPAEAIEMFPSITPEMFAGSPFEDGVPTSSRPTRTTSPRWSRSSRRST